MLVLIKKPPIVHKNSLKLYNSAIQKFLAAKHPSGDVQHVQRGTLVVSPFVFAYRRGFHPDVKSRF